MPYFPPHRGGVETVGEEIGQNWTKNDFGEFINVVTDFEQELFLNYGSIEKIIFDGEIIGYKKDDCEVLVVPSIEIINNFPVYKIWSKEYKIIKKYLKQKIGDNKNYWRVITHTRFFLTSFIGGLSARSPHPNPLPSKEREYNRIKWIHIEHGSSYVLLSSKLKSYISIIYDKTIGKWVFKKADRVLAISKVSKEFILNKFIKREISVFYRGLDFLYNLEEKNDDVQIVYIGRLVFLKGVSNLIDAYISSRINNKLIIIGDGEEKIKLEEKSKGKNIHFLGYKNREFVFDFLSKHNCILVNPSFSEGMPTTVIEGLLTKNVVVATDVGGTKEITNHKDLILFKAGDEKELKKNLIYAVENYSKLKGVSFEEIKNKFSRENNILKLYNLVK
ncbi:MAG: glycosyltransferase family 4 protein [Candidatus Gracilibacteria bacterium]|nr:glycosyltransferase family 4 protein [Candidatus Gracilibacteria bacterium]